jgi:hypothetical protein
MPQTVTQDSGGKPTGWKGPKAGVGEEETARRVAEQAARDAYQKAQGMAGIGKAGARSKPEWKKREDAYIAGWRKEQEAKRVAQAKAAKDLAEKEEPTKVAAAE